MFRHSSSFIISLLFHSLLLIVIFYSYKALSSSAQEEIQEKRVCVALSCLPHKAEEPHKPTPSQPKEIKSEKKKPQKKVSKEVKKIEKPKKVIEPVVEDLIVVEEEPKEPEEVIKEEHEIKKLEEPVQTQEKITQEIQTEANAQVDEEVKDTSHKEAKSSPQETYMNQHLQEIIRLLQENLYYPRSARKRGIEGEVVVRFKLSRNAEVISIKILSSEHSILSRGAIKTIESLSQKFPEPKEDIVLSIPINYSLRR